MRRAVTMSRITDLVPVDLLEILQEAYQNYLQTSAAIYELDGSYAACLITSKYCNCLTDACEAKAGKGKGVCHDDCWQISKKSIDLKKPFGEECSGGLFIYSVPIMLDGTPIGAANAAVSNPPKDIKTIKEIAEKYGISVKELQSTIDEYEDRPEYVREAAKKQIETTARTIGSLYKVFYELREKEKNLTGEIAGRKRLEDKLKTINESLEGRVAERTKELVSEITERKRAEEQLKESLKEKEVLLQEIHHRVKNNLQIISSLLDMSRIRTHNEEAIGLLKDAGSRVSAMALIHSQLYKSDRFDRINMEKHLREVTNSLLQLYGQKKDITIDIKASEVYLAVSRAIPCALVLNELVSNALKHGFSGRPKGMLEISMQRLTGDTVRMYVKDNGIGIPEEADPFKADSLGLKLVRNLVEKQLKGKLQFKRNKGTEFIVEFKDTGEDEENG